MRNDPDKGKKKGVINLYDVKYQEFLSIHDKNNPSIHEFDEDDMAALEECKTQIANQNSQSMQQIKPPKRKGSKTYER